MSKTRPTAIPGRTSRAAGVAALLGAAALLTGALPAHAAPAAPPADVVPGEGTATPALVDNIAEQAPASAAPADAARDHLAAKKSRYRIDNPQRDLAAADTVRDGADETVRFQQKHRGVKVLGGQYLVRMQAKDGERLVTGTSGKYFTGLDVDATASVPAATASERALSSVRTQLTGGQLRLPAKQGKGGAPQLSAASHGLVVLPQGTGVLTHHITVTGYDPVAKAPVKQEVYVDAHAGFPVLSYSGIQNAVDPAESRAKKPKQPGTTGKGVKLDGRKVTLEVEKRGSSYLLIDNSRTWKTSKNPITTWDAAGVDVGDASGTWPAGIKEVASPSKKFDAKVTESGAVDAHWAAGQVYDYYKKQHHRDSLDGRGMAINSLVGITEYGFPYVNAFWDGDKMVYGSGDEEFKSLAADLDVVGHEMTHGVVEHTAGLVYTGQSGALNEAVADYFGNAIDVTVTGNEKSPDAGLIGEDLCRTKSPRDCALRDLNDGRTTSKDFLGVAFGYDRGGVHLNSTIFSGALWDIREDLGGKQADRIVYKALTEYLTPLDGFTEARAAVLAAAKDLGVKGDKLKKVTRAFAAHGIVPGWEQAIGVDTDTLLGDLNTRGTEPGAGGGWWAVAKSDAEGEEAYSVWAGRTDGKGGAPKLISPNDGRYHTSPDTDGTTVVWVAVGPNGSEVLSRSLKGGPIRKVRTLPSLAGAAHVSGDVVTWQEEDADRKPRVAWVRGNDPKVHYADGDDAAITTALPTLSGTKLAYGKVYPTPDGYSEISTEILDLDTGKKVLLPAKGGHIGIANPVLTGKHLYWLVDNIMDDNRQILRRANVDGSGMTDLIEETDERAYIWSLDATDSAVTYTYFKPGQDLVNTSLQKLVQADPDGKNQQRVSCSRGEQYGVAADTGKRVVWGDGTTGHTNLVTRDRPAGRC
ncbi:M4 family metallopeptidase [Streptomyces sp. NPDC087440]|uniref:M4 family metallopeptidase n=1 Tax=Streptomyces sp. NPDC087440 TaxID=3365790 RepID=UPI003822795B